MDALGQESLFSLELVVDKIHLPKIVCRFPAVAFRLLDFPTLLIYHVEPDLADVIREKISRDPHYKLPPQLHELQDKQGDFAVKKGKSCLFKVPLHVLHTHLSNTPLYVMLIDTYPEVPKLIGSCSVPLDDSVQLITEDVENLGLSVPSVHGERGDFSIFNMMGSEIGKIELGFRLLSLGVGLIPHIPDNALVKFKQKTITLEKTKDATSAMEAADVVLQDIQAVDKPIQVDIFTPGPTTEQIMQTEDDHVDTVATQTMRSISKKKGKSMDMADEFFVTNTVCPPPLFYNVHSEPKKEIKTGLTFNDGTLYFSKTNGANEYFINGATAGAENSGKYNNTYFEDNEDMYSEYSESTIRHEDKFSDSENEEYVDFSTSKIKSQRKPLRKTLLKSSPDESRSQLLAQAASFQVPSATKNLAQFPLINALLNEIVNLQGLGGQSTQMAPVSGIGHISQKVPQVKSAWSEQGSPRSARKQESREEFLHRLATPRGEHDHREEEAGFHKGKRSCASPHKAVPKNMSWLKMEPTRKPVEQGVKKIKLSFGMTNTQRLRLAKGNPELLRTLEKREEQRVAERKKNQKQSKPGPTERPQIKQRMSISKAKQESIDDTKFSLDLGSTGMDTLESPKQHRRPVPTPRLSLTGDRKDLKTREKFNEEKQRLIRQMAQLSHTPSEKSESSKHSYYTAERQPSIKSQKSIDVYLPSIDTHADRDDEATSHDEESDFGEMGKSALGQTKVLSGPGFPRESVDSRLSMVSSFSAQYSDDFEDEKHGNSIDEPALKKVVEHLSEATDESALEPSLRKVVDQYSDDGEEPSLRKIVDKYSDDDTISGEEPSLRKVVDRYSDESTSRKSDTKSSGSNRSVRSHKSRQTSPEEITQDIKVKNLPMPNPTSSLRSPTSHNQLRSSVVTREGMAASTPSGDESVSEIESSTARIPRSQMPSQSFETGTSLDSTGEAAWKRRRQPRPSPRRSLERIRTESVSSYNPSDPENLSPMSPGAPEDLYSESFDDFSEQPSEPKYAKDIKIPATAKGLGYTWT